MPKGDDSKQKAFQMWNEGRTLNEIIRASTAKPESLKDWVLQWERGKQRTWTPQIHESE